MMSSEDQAGTETTPLDGLISRIRSYIQDPKLVTRETLMEIESELEDLKSVVDGEPEESGESEDDGKQPSLSIMIGKAKRMGGGY